MKIDNAKSTKQCQKHKETQHMIFGMGEVQQPN